MCARRSRTHARTIIGHETWPAIDLERRQNRHFIFGSLVALDAVGIAHKPPRCENRGRQTHKPSTVTLAAHARRGLITTWLLTAQTKPEENWESTLVGFDQFT